MSRQDLFMAVKIKQLKTKDEIFRDISATPDAQGCEVCKPAIGSIISSLYNEHVMKPQHHHNQDTNDRFLGNSDYGLYTKITGGQRIDMFGAQKQDLPAIWTRLHEAGLESGTS
jgi:nitrite reductase (NAD(P)H)